MTEAMKKDKKKGTPIEAASGCKHCCFHLMDGYLHGHDVPLGHVKEECCRCHATRIISREECQEIASRERTRERESDFSHKGWSLSEEDRCRRVRKTFDAGDEPKPKGGFALLPEDVRRELARKGGRTAQQQPNPRRWTSETAREAGRLGGRAVHNKRRELAGQQA